MAQYFVSNPRVTLDLVSRDQRIGSEDLRDLIVGQLQPATQARGSILFAANPLASATITLNGVAWTFVASGATGNQTNIGGSLAATLATLVTNLNASANAEIAKATYSAGSDTLYIVYDTPGTAGNSWTLAASLATPSGATLAGGAAAPGAAAAGLTRDLPRTEAEIVALFGEQSHVTMECLAYRRVNTFTNVDVIALADAGAATPGTAAITISGTATQDKTIYLSVVSAELHRYEIDIESGDTPGDVSTKILAAVGDDEYVPFIASVSGQNDETVTFTAVNRGTVSNEWLISLLDLFDRPGTCAGLTFTLTGWTGGATDPSLTNVFDPVALIRYQGVVWPEAYDLETAKDWIDDRKNVDNNVMDGTLYVWRNDAFADVKALSLVANSSEAVIFTNKVNDLAHWRGPHVPEAGDVMAAKAAAAISRRREDGVSISDLVVVNEPKDQFGGLDKASLPLFNTPFIGCRRPIWGTGYSYEEQLELENAGVTVVGYNRQNNAVIMGQVVTTFQNDAAGNSDDTWKYLEWRHTHGAIREYFVLNLRKEFAQHRLTRGVNVPGYAMASEESIRAFLIQLYDELAEFALTVRGNAYRRLFEDRLVVTLNPASRRAEVSADCPMVSQLGEIIGSVKFNFDLAA